MGGQAPFHYRLALNLDHAGLRWTGNVEIDRGGGPIEGSLDCDGLEVEAVRVDGQAVTFREDPDGQRLVFAVPNGGARSVAIDFAGKVETKNLFGLYRSRHGAGHLVTSHCEPTGARHIFPCVDRPDLKARIELTVRADPELEVIANAPVRSTRIVGGVREWAFEPTPEMSTYLFYLGVGSFDYREDRASRVALRVATPPGRGEAGSWALRSGGRILRAYEEYYGIPYPLPKLDLIAVTEHSFGAMENWGAISFQETRLLVDGSSSSYAPRDVFVTTAHEIAHQWFGNLVTMAWWDDIWLNESFAALMETKISDRLEPGFDLWADFFLRTAGKAAALDGDSLASTHPVRTRVERPEELSQIFDEISYGKGSTILAMLDLYLGEERFRTGVTDYLERFRYRNARTADLWQALERASGEPVSALAGPWIDRPGLPVVSASVGPRGLELAQRRFAYLGSTDEEPWPIPMVLDVDGRPQRLLFDRRTHEVPVPPAATVHLNPGSIGFYRVKYDPVLLDRLVTALAHRPGRDRWAVLDDLAAFVTSGDADWATYRGAVERLGDAPDRLVVETLTNQLVAFALDLPEVDAVQRTAREFLARQCERIGLDRRPGEAADVGIVRDRVTFGRVRVDPGFAHEISGRFGVWDRLDPDLRGAVAIAYARAGGPRAFGELRAALDRPQSDVEALRLERALPWSPEPARIREALDLAASGRINRGHVLAVTFQAASNPAGRELAWTWLEEHLGTLTEIFRGSGYLPLVLEAVLPLVGRGRAAEVRRFFEGRELPEGSRGVAKGLERLEIAERLAARFRGPAADR